MRLRSVFAWLLLTILCTTGNAQTRQADAEPSASRLAHLYPLPRYEEDWTFLRGTSGSSDFWDFTKLVPLAEHGRFFLSLGGEARETYERFHNTSFGLTTQDADGYLLQRYLLHGDLHYGSKFRFFAELNSSLENGRTGGPRPLIDEDRLDVHQGFVDLVLPSSRPNSAVTLRIGRQELAFGSGRLVALREGPNVPLSFDGIRASLTHAALRVTAFATRPVQNKSGIFDDPPQPGSAFWGVYASRSNLAGLANIDFYYFGLNRRRAIFNQGVREETRHSLGARFWKTSQHWSFDAEGIYQFGNFGGGTITAWRLADDSAYTFSSIRFRPRVAVATDIASGDRDPRDPHLQTFNALFQSGTYSGRAQILGPNNAIRLEPSVALQLAERVTASAGWGFYWRQNAGDGLYGIPGNLIVPANGVSSRYEGSRPIAQVDWQVTRHLSAHLNYIYVFNARFEEQSVHGTHSMSFVSPWITYRF